MHSHKTTHTLSPTIKKLKGLLAKGSIANNSFRGNGKRRLFISLLSSVLILTSFLMLSGYYGRSVNAAPRTMTSIFSDSYFGVSRSWQYLKTALFGAPKGSANLFSTVTATPTISGCYYSGGQSRATVSVEVSWTGLANGNDITVSLPGALNGVTSVTITQQTGANPPVVTPQVVAFEVASGFSERVLKVPFKLVCLA